MGILEVVAFIFGFVGSIGALEKWSLLLSVFGASMIVLSGSPGKLVPDNLAYWGTSKQV
jgi:hypothetical protein